MSGLLRIRVAIPFCAVSRSMLLNLLAHRGRDRRHHPPVVGRHGFRQNPPPTTPPHLQPDTVGGTLVAREHNGVSLPADVVVQLRLRPASPVRPGVIPLGISTHVTTAPPHRGYQLILHPLPTGI